MGNLAIFILSVQCVHLTSTSRDRAANSARFLHLCCYVRYRRVEINGESACRARCPDLEGLSGIAFSIIQPPYLKAAALGIETWLDSERSRLPLWLPVGLGVGVVLWEMLGNAALPGVILLCLAIHLAGRAIGNGSRFAALLKIGSLCIMAGFLAIFIRSASVAAPPLEKIRIAEFYAQITKVEHLSARNIVRFELKTAANGGLPAKLRVNLAPEKYREEFVSGAIIQLRARLMPPAGQALPGAYDFARRAWFSGLGATGSVLGDITLHRPASQRALLGSARHSLSEHILSRLPADTGSIAAALATGQRGAISDEDAQAMRDSGMAHLLSISGLHVTAVVGAIFLLLSRLLALFPFVALRLPVPLIAASVAAIGAIGYTLLTGAHVPTVRSCIAALLILTALALGRDPLSLRLVAFGAAFVLIMWPETLAGPSFQMSFAAVSTIIVLHESKWMRRFAQRREEGILRRLGRGIMILFATGLAIEMMLAPIALFHFHKTGLYGALANIVAIPLTTFVVMPFEALALLFDLVGLGAPFWWIAGQGIALILAIAHGVSAMPGAVSMLPVMPLWAFGFIIMGALWFGIFRTRWRYGGIAVFAVGLSAMLVSPYPDMLVTGDGKHLALVDGQGRLALLRERAGDYVRDTLRENAGVKAEPVGIEDWPGVQCSADACVIALESGAKSWTVMAIRSRYLVPSMELAAACKRVDIVVSGRYLPYSCKPRWIKADRRGLEQTGGLAFYLGEGRAESVAAHNGHKPWAQATRRARQKREASRAANRKLRVNPPQ